MVRLLGKAVLLRFQGKELVCRVGGEIKNAREVKISVKEAAGFINCPLFQ